MYENVSSNFSFHFFEYNMLKQNILSINWIFSRWKESVKQSLNRRCPKLVRFVERQKYQPYIVAFKFIFNYTIL